MTDDPVKQALAELGDVVRCRCHEAFRDRGLHDPQCQCDSADAVRVVIARVEWLERERVLDAKLLADTQALLDKAVEVLRKAQIASCTCQIKTPDPDWHNHNCRYRILREIEAMIEHLPDADALAAIREGRNE